MGKSLSQIRRELNYYKKRNQAISKRRQLTSELRKEKYRGLSEFWGGTKAFGSALGKSARAVGGSLASIGDNYSPRSSYKPSRRKKRRKMTYSYYGGIPNDLGF